MTRTFQMMLGIAALLCSATYAFRTLVEAGLSVAGDADPGGSCVATGLNVAGYNAAPRGDWDKPPCERANYRREIARHGEPQIGGTGI